MSRAAWALVAAMAGAAALFTLWPGLDLAVSALFYDPASESWAADAPLAEALRQAVWALAEGAALGFGLLALIALARRGRAAIPARLWGFGFLAMALGPGLLVNGLLKANWGRARPRAVEPFGGDAAFTAALEPAAECARNCSFVSGEAAAAATLALIVWLIAGRQARGAGRWLVALALVVLAAGTGILRVAGGGHFLSDVVFAALFTAALTLALWRLTGAADRAATVTWSDLAADLGALIPGRNRRK